MYVKYRLTPRHSRTFHLFAFRNRRLRDGGNGCCCCWHRQIDEKRKIINLRLRAAFVIIHDIFTEPCTNYTAWEGARAREREKTVWVRKEHTAPSSTKCNRFCARDFTHNKMFHAFARQIENTTANGKIIIIIFALTFIQSRSLESDMVLCPSKGKIVWRWW